MSDKSSSRSELAGIRVLVTRAQRQAEDLSSRLQDCGAEIIEVPLIEIRPPASWKPLDQALATIEKYDWLILTSANGAEALFSRLKKLKIPTQKLRRLQIACIGPATRQVAERHGLPVAVMPSEYIAEAVVRTLRNRVRGRRVLLVRAAVARDVIPRELQQAGAEVHTIAAYRTSIPRAAKRKLRLLFQKPERRPQVITFASSSTARNFCRLLGKQCYTGALDGTAIASVGPITSATLRELGLPVAIEARPYTMQGITQAIIAWARRRRLAESERSSC